MREGEPTRVERRADVDREIEEDVEPTSTWHDIKSRSVDDPEGALAAAEDLVRSAVDERVRRLKEGLEELRLSEPPGKGASATEQLRTRLIRYQAYYESIRETTKH